MCKKSSPAEIPPTGLAMNNLHTTVIMALLVQPDNLIAKADCCILCSQSIYMLIPYRSLDLVSRRGVTAITLSMAQG